MKVGIFVHSKTGNTYSVALKLKDRLLLEKHFVLLEKVVAENDQVEAQKLVLTSAPDTQGYDYLIFGAPVWAFSLSPVMNAYLSQIGSLEGIKVFCYVTQQMAFPWMGGNRAVRQMTKLLSEKGAVIVGSGVVNWSSQKRGYLIGSILDRAAGAISAKESF